MSIVFALRADNAAYAARNSLNTTAAAQIGGGTISYDVDNTTIGGHCINMDQGSSASRTLSYFMRGNHTAKAISVLMRMKLGSTALGGFWQIGQPSGLSINNIIMFTSANLYQITSFNDAGATVANGSFAAGAPATGVWTDMVLVWDGTTSSNKLQLYIDGTATNTTAGAAWPTTTSHEVFSIGAVSTGVTQTRIKVEEVVVWNTAIDPTSVALTSGTGSLNGASRTALVDVTAFNGGLAGASSKGSLGIKRFG